MISAFLDAWLRPSKSSQPNTRTVTKYSRRKDTNRDHAPTRQPRQIAAQRSCTEFWGGTRTYSYPYVPD